MSEHLIRFVGGVMDGKLKLMDGFGICFIAPVRFEEITCYDEYDLVSDQCGNLCYKFKTSGVLIDREIESNRRLIAGWDKTVPASEAIVKARESWHVSA